MCLIAFAWQTDARYQLVLAANRDEFRARPTSRAGFWPNYPELLGGRDLSGGGTWLAVTRAGRFSALTNIRNPALPRTGKHSRGELVVDACLARARPADKSEYGGYNLLIGDAPHHSLQIDGNHPAQQPAVLAAGFYGLSNGTLDEPWPKTGAARRMLAPALALTLADPLELADTLLDQLHSVEVFADRLLPDTGIGLERERALSPLFIDLPEYGTRTSTVLLIEHSGMVHMVERSYDAAAPDTITHQFEIEPAVRP